VAITGVDHIVVRVKDIDEGIASYRDNLGMELERTDESEALGIKQAFFPFADGGFLEVVAPTSDDSAVGKAVASRGEGIHTVSLAVDNMEQTIKDMEAKGVVLIGGAGGGPVFVHPKSAHGVLVQLTEK
jgi:methylmalonyl-CoA/ethylmalonyl-CoA epimerase